MKKEVLKKLPIGTRVQHKTTGKIGKIMQKAADNSAAFVVWDSAKLNLPFYITGGDISWSNECWVEARVLKYVQEK